MLISVKEYAAKLQVSPSTVQRRLNRGELKGRRFGRVWYVEINAAEEDLAGDQLIENKEINDITRASTAPQLEQLLAFSSKALNSYLMMSDRLIVEKDKAYQEKNELLKIEQQRVAELKSYVAMLEKLLFDDRAHAQATHNVVGLKATPGLQASAPAFASSMDDGFDDNSVTPQAAS
jgi:IS30 family transposase